METSSKPTDVAELQKQLDLAKKDLERLEQIKPLAHLASTVVHDIRNSLGIISSTSQFVLTHLKPEEKEKQAWEMVVRNVETIKNILKSYLGFAKQFETNREATVLNDVVNRVCHYLEAPARKQNTKIEKDLETGNCSLLLDVAAIESSILNIALNALEAVEHDGAVQFLTRLDGQAKNLELVISDTGAGIAPDVQIRLFQPFFTTKKSGTGMGLYSAKVALENHGGKILCESAPGQGTRFTLTLPVKNTKA